MSTNFLCGETEDADGISFQYSTSLAPQSSILIVGTQEATRQFDVESFIDIVRDIPCIWNTSCRSYKEHGKRRNAWNNIANYFHKDGTY